MDQIEIVEFPEADAAPHSPPDRRKHASALNSRNAGCPEGSEHSDRTTYPAPEVIEAAAKAIIEGRRSPLSIRNSSGPITDADRIMFNRATGMPLEEFQAQLSARLQQAALMTGDKVIEKLNALEPGEGKLNELTFLWGVTVDKLTTLSGRSQIQNANIGTQINIVTSESGRAEILASLRQERKVTPIA